MTREEAIAYGEDYLKDLISACCHIEEKHKDFVRMAIEALEQELCEDAVSRKAIDQNIYDYAESNGLSYANLKNAILDTLPVTPTTCIAKVTFDKDDLQELVDEKVKELTSRKVGKWVANHDESDDSHTIDCSCCNYTLVRVVNRGYTAEQALDCVKEMTKNYCPKCGADMRGIEDGSN